MKQNLLKIGALGLAIMAFTACENDDALQELNPENKTSALIKEGCDVIDFETASMGTFITEVYSVKGMGPVMLENKARNSNGEIEGGNRAMIFNTEAPTGDDEDLYTIDWGKALIIQELGVENEPNDNQWGGEMMLTFPEAVTLESMNVLDIDTYEDNSWVHLYDGDNNELYKVMLKPLGNNSKQVVNLGKTGGVMKVKVVLAGKNGYVGSGAIDDLVFCLPTSEEEAEGCTYTQGYWKNHPEAWGTNPEDIKPETPFILSKTYMGILKTAPKGDAKIILAHQYIAAILNLQNGASSTTEVDLAIAGAKAYFNGTSTSRSQLLEWAELLDKYNNGIIGPGHCD